ncbi:hypothetical protein LTR85_011792 [Meristemomyces frigidus]|nr:hypothetical protein LTR85_011792 [Meristemomyces frigidus]
MATTTAPMADISMPAILAKHEDFLEYLAKRPHGPLPDIIQPYHQYDAEMRKIFAQHPDHPAINQPNVVPVFAGHEKNVEVRPRDIAAESEEEKAFYIMPLTDEDRRPDHVPAIVQSLRDFKNNFSVFSESSLIDLDWSNVIAAGSSVVTALLPVPEKHAGSKRALRTWYHEQLAPASDVDLFLYGLTEEQAVEKIKQIERSVRDALLVETTTIRTKNTVTIASQYPVRHVQIVLRIYRSISEILTGFDVDCSCVAYDGQQVWASPRALVAYMTQTNTVDLTRRSPSYENRLSKYAKRGFEVYWPTLDRSKVDPTIFERSFGRTEGLARLLVLEKLPRSKDRDAYLDQRRTERGRPPVNRTRTRQHTVYGNIKDDHEDEVAEWADADEVSDYHTFTIPYGPKYHARKIERLLYTKDMLLNAEWNRPKHREVNLHRHPAFFGTTDDVIHDCCGHCPKPSTMEEEAAAVEESKVYVSRDISFIKDDPGRQAIGSFNPLDADDWTEMAYVSNTGSLCQAIVDGDAEFVSSWLRQKGNDPNARDWTGRTPLHLAVANSTPDIVQLLIDHGARIVARLVDGKTALHLAAQRGDVHMVSALLRKSAANEAEAEEKDGARQAGWKAAKADTQALVDLPANDGSQSPLPESPSEEGDSDIDMVEGADEDEGIDTTTENSMVNIRTPAPDSDDKALAIDDDEEPDVFDVNVVAWDTAASPLHLAIVGGHANVVTRLVQDFGADVLMPIKLFNDHDKSARAAILTLVLALQLPAAQADEIVRTLLRLGASVAQADVDHITALQCCVADRPDQLDNLINTDKIGVGRAINHLSVSGYQWNVDVSGPLLTAIRGRDTHTALKLLSAGAKPVIDFSRYMAAYKTKHDPPKDAKQNRRSFDTTLEQPLLKAIQCELPVLAKALMTEHALDPNALTLDGYRVFHDEYHRGYTEGQSLLDAVRSKIKQLREWKPEDPTNEAPKPLKDDAFYLSKYEQCSYALWYAQRQLESAKRYYAHEVVRYEAEMKVVEEKRGVEEKRSVILQAIREYEELEYALLAAGARTFYELHPDIERPESGAGLSTYRMPEPKPFEVEFTFRLGDLDDETSNRYVRLFEASWAGDATTVKELTWTPWKASEDSDRPPLQVAVQDAHGMSPFAIAIMHGNIELASIILRIAEVQHAPPDTPLKQRRYRIDFNVPNPEDDGSDEDIPIHSEVTDDQFTVENIGEISTQVKSQVSPLSMIEWTCAAFKRFDSDSSVSSDSGLDSHEAKLAEPDNLLQLAVFRDDTKLLTHLLSILQECVRQETSNKGTKQRFYSIRESDFVYAVTADRPQLLEAMIERTGAGLPLNRLVEESGAEVREEATHYQGLSVRGKKRQDWRSARGGQPVKQFETSHPPLLVSAHHSSLKLVEWFLSDAPMRCYNVFSAVYEDDVRLQRLAQVTSGFEASARKFLAARSDLSIHCCIMGNRASKDDGRLLRYLINAVPSSVDAKSSEGLMPLAIAMELYDDVAVRILIEAGADQTARDLTGNNVLHRLLSRLASDERQVQRLPLLLDLVDKRLMPSLFLERSADHPGSFTPLARWMHNRSVRSDTDEERDAEFLRTLLRYSGGKELNLVNGEGDTPLHVTVRKTLPHLTGLILKHSPMLLNRESATGRTPFEMAEDAAVAALCSDAPPLPGNYHFDERRARREGLPSSWATDLVHRPTSDFLEEPGRDRRDKREKVWDLLVETKHMLKLEGKDKRRLVTLNEASEVARRLAAVGSGSSMGRGDENVVQRETLRSRDEVQTWLPRAGLRL